ncbi:MAG: hypothetical protein HY699_19085 [Deltaproteobacteria bacterium]|nr:hypothetical protein [Deltaproteobacteria bacterium]
MNRADCLYLGLALWFLAAPPVRATTVMEKNLDSLCAEADHVFTGKVVAIEPQWTDAARRHIETVVTFETIEPLYGADSAFISLRFAGGQIGDLVERVQGVPRFARGEHGVIFARDGHFASPLVGFHQGYFRVQGEGEAAAVLRPSYEFVGALADGSRLLSSEVQGVGATPLRGFLDALRQRLRQREANQ